MTSLSARKDRHIGVEHVVLALLRGDDKISEGMFQQLGVAPKEMRELVLAVCARRRDAGPAPHRGPSPPAHSGVPDELQAAVQPLGHVVCLSGCRILPGNSRKERLS